jgi:putative hydrolase of the HAD superfamily
MIVAFDLDDTLYRELDYVESGFAAVAGWLEEHRGLPATQSVEIMATSLIRSGRGQQFDDLLKAYDLFTVRLRDQLIRVYRDHEPRLRLPDASRAVLVQLARAGHRLFVVTDGHSRVQARKINALGVADLVEHCYITWRHGRDAQKPSTRCFELMLRRTRSTPDDLVYVGDNPMKDFIGVRALGGSTIRVLTGSHSHLRLDAAHEADVAVGSITEVPSALDGLVANG